MKSAQIRHLPTFLLNVTLLGFYAFPALAVEYTITFNGSWNANDISVTFPPSAHFTQLLTHASNTVE
jgi:hypothetical protein